MAKRKATQTASNSSAPSKPAPAKKARFSNPPPPAPAAASNKVKGKAVAPAPKPEITPYAPKRFVVAAGSYERLLYGIECTFVPSNNEQEPYQLSVEPIFSFPAHLSSLRTVAASVLSSPATGSERKVGGKYLVSGGTDEIIRVWDLRRKKEMGSLEGDTTGTITCMSFVPQRNMLLAASSDSTIALYRVRDWVLLRGLKGHKGRVNAVDAHPDGRVALSVGQDRMLRMWDLVAGKSVTAMKLGVEGDAVRWNTNGTKFVVICNNNLTVYGLDMSIHHSLTAPSRFHDARFCYFPLDTSDPTQREYLFVACEDGKVRVFDVSEPTPIENDGQDLSELDLPKMEPFAELVGHSNRVKQMDLLEVALPSTSTASSADSTVVLTTISSDGKIHLYDLARLSPPSTSTKAKKGKETTPETTESEVKQIQPSASYDTDKTRLTCVCAVGMVERKGKNGAQQEEGGSESESDEEEEDSEDDEEEEEALQSGEEDEFVGIGELEDEEDEDEEEEDE
ncbi:hypothetical protein JCM11641_006227 [Rhodosporidiobolus odoratus]